MNETLTRKEVAGIIINTASIQAKAGLPVNEVFFNKITDFIESGIFPKFQLKQKVWCVNTTVTIAPWEVEITGIIIESRLRGEICYMVDDLQDRISEKYLRATEAEALAEYAGEDNAG